MEPTNYNVGRSNELNETVKEAFHGKVLEQNHTRNYEEMGMLQAFS